MATLPHPPGLGGRHAGPPTVLAVAALAEELAHVRGVETLATGVGKALAAAGLARRLATGPRPDLVVNLGTAGTVELALAGVHEVEVVTQHDFPYPAIESLVGAGTPRAFSLRRDDPPQPLPSVPVGVRVLATGDVFVADRAAAARIAALGVQLVDMEAYAYAATCHAFAVPMRCVKAVSDGADADAGLSWIDALDRCARSLAEWLEAFLSTA